jgi:hypothetical protein
MRLRVLIVISVTLSSTTLVAPAVRAQTAADSASIRAAALDYIEGWYTADAPRMQRALHPELAKRVVVTDSTSGKSQLGQMGAMTLIEYTRNGGGRETPPGARRKDVSILDVFRGAASAKIVAADWIDYLHLARWNGRWVIVNVLWEPKGSSTRASTKPSK